MARTSSCMAATLLTIFSTFRGVFIPLTFRVPARKVVCNINYWLPIPPKRKLVQLMIWSIMSYGSETWIYLKSVQNMIKVFERWCYRRMLRISWTEHVTNEEVCNRANTKPTLLDGLKRRLAFHGHLVRKDGITLDLMIGRLHGTRPRGRPITTWLKDLATQANISYKEAITMPTDRKKWRSVGNPRRTPDE